VKRGRKKSREPNIDISIDCGEQAVEGLIDFVADSLFQEFTKALKKQEQKVQEEQK